jgi:hypothetical protein
LTYYRGNVNLTFIRPAQHHATNQRCNGWFHLGKLRGDPKLGNELNPSA